MKIGLVGLPGSGKSTLFAALTGEPPEAAAEYGTSTSKIITVPDARLEALRDIYSPRKFTLAQIEVHDFPGVDATALKGNSKMFASMREMDALAVVLRTFEDASFPHDPAAPDAARDWENLLTDFQVADLEMIERRIEKLRVAVRKPTKTQEQDKKELAVLEKCQAAVDDGQRLATVELNAADEEILGGFRFLTQKPTMAVFNLADDDEGAVDLAASLAPAAEKSLSLRGNLESEIAQLEEDEAAEFMSDFGITEPARHALIRELFDLVGLHSFFTAGPDEVRAWTIEKGDSAVIAAGKIHSDIQRGFIRAEVMPYAGFMEAGDERAAKAAGVPRLEGKEYVVADADIINFRFSV